MRLRPAILVLALSAADVAHAADRICVPRATPIGLSRDIVRWSISMRAGQTCIQGLRYSSMVIDRVTLITAPKNGRVEILGSGFRFLTDPNFRGSDHFTISVFGQIARKPGNSLLEVDATID